MPAEMPKSTAEGEKRPLDREIRHMISALTTHLTDVQQVSKPGSSGPLGNEDERGLSIITLAGTNMGATMKGDVLNRPHKLNDHEESLADEPEGLGESYVNSNYQAVNNSIMLDSSYTSHDPGVHLDMPDVVDPFNIRSGKFGRRGIRKGKGLAHASDNPDSEFTE